MTHITQAILSAISAYVLALIAFNLFGSRLIFYGTFILYTFSSYVSIWDTFIFAESLGSSMLIFSLYFLLEARNKLKKKDFLLAGFFLIWAIFLRPFLIPIVLGYFIVILWPFIKEHNYKASLKYLLYFMIPILIVEGSWTTRNYIYAGEIVPLQTRVTFNKHAAFSFEAGRTPALQNFVASFGGDGTWWNPNGALYWFLNNDSYTEQHPFPDQIFDKNHSIEDLEEVKKMCIAINADKENLQMVLPYDSAIVSSIKSFHDSYKVREPFYYNVTSRFVQFRKFMYHSGVYNLPFPAFNEQTLIQKAIKGVYSLLYLLTVSFGLLSSIYLFVTNIKKDLFIAFIYGIPLYLIVLFPILMRVQEFRFNTLAYPFFLMALVTVAVQIYSRFRPSTNS